MNDVTIHELYSVIRRHCLECSGGSVKLTDNCKVKQCNLYPYRMGDGSKRKKKPGQLKGQIAIENILKG